MGNTGENKLLVKQKKQVWWKKASLVSLIAKRYYIVPINALGPVKISGFCP
jgi:hypothetical protein